jgi:DNA-binding SARP family transcriptional activator/Leucine-rich repeat (LRR) protein
MATEEHGQQLTILLFGTLQLNLEGTSLNEKISAKAMCLLAYLAYEFDRSHRREYLAEMLWPDKPPGIARNNLRQTLSILRSNLGDREASVPFLHVTRETIQFNPQSDYFADVNMFRDLHSTSLSHQHEALAICETCLNGLQRAVEMYQGDFLADIPLIESPAFEEWTIVTREALKRKMVDILQTLISLSESHQNFQKTSDYARRLVEIEPWEEENHRLLMQSLAMAGYRTAALKQYEICQRVIFNEFGVETTKETTTLYEAIRDGKYNQALENSLSKISPEGMIIDRKLSHEPIKRTPFQIQAPPLWIIIGVIIIAISFFLYQGEGFTLRSQEDQTPTNTPEATVLIETIVPTNTQPSYPLLEREALVALYNSTGGKDWTVSEGWNSDDTHCNWYGVKCSDDIVTKLQLPNNNLRGDLPDQINNLSNLAVLDLRENELTGGIPTTLGTLEKLAELNLSYNHLEGKIPPELGNLKNLVSLSVKGNAGLIGTIPPELGNLRALRLLALSSYDGGTELYGWIPPEIGNLVHLTHLEICNSKISGPIPPEIGNLTGLVFIDLSNNPFSGELPEELGNLTNAVVFFLGEGKNSLRGPLPTSLVNLTKIELFQFHETDICEPRDPLLQSWLTDVPELYRTGVFCDEVDGN